MRSVTSASAEGTVYVKGSKSHVQRLLAAALVNRDETVIDNVLMCDDVRIAAGVLKKCGRAVDIRSDSITVHSGETIKADEFNMGESALALRMFIPVLSEYMDCFKITGKPSLFRRNGRWFKRDLEKAGIEFRMISSRKAEVRRVRRSHKIFLKGGKSSQLLTGLLLAGKYDDRKVCIHAGDVVSGQYLDMTIETIRTFGGDVRKEGSLYVIEKNMRHGRMHVKALGDWSNAAYWLVWGAVNGDIRISGLDGGVDSDILRLLYESGANIKNENGTIHIMKSDLRPFDFNGYDTPDLIPPVAVLGAAVRGKSTIRGTERLRIKESDRERYLLMDLKKCGVDIHYRDGFVINGGRIKGGRVLSSHGDHRLAMSYALAGVLSDRGVVIKGEGCVRKSYDGFFREMASLRGGNR